MLTWETSLIVFNNRNFPFALIELSDRGEALYVDGVEISPPWPTLGKSLDFSLPQFPQP